MKSKKILIITILILSACVLGGCSNSNSNDTSSKENNTAKSETTVESNSVQNKSTEDTNSNKKETTTETNTVAEDKSLIFKAKLGFSIKFPSNWKDRYTIKEDNNSMRVYFKSTDPNTPPNTGLFFLIMKKNDSLNEDMYDSIDGQKYIKVGNTTYFIGGPTDVGLSPENKDFKIFSAMNKERKEVINTMASLN